MSLPTQGILHLHIPKTAGTALREHFVTQVGESNVTPRLSGIGLREALVHYQTTPVIAGHLLAIQGDRLPHDRCSIVLLRNPVDRVLSQFFYTQQHKPRPLLDVRFRTMGLRDYLDSLDADAECDLLLQRDMLYPLATRFEACPTMDEKLIAARQALAAFQFVGVQDELDDFAAMLDTHFDWPECPLRRHNVTVQRTRVEDLDAKQLRRLKTLLEPELELYADAQIRFHKDRRRFIRMGGSALVTFTTHATTTTGEPMPQEPANFGSHVCTIDRVEVRGHEAGSACPIQGEPMTVTLHFTAHHSIEKIVIGFGIRDDKNLVMFGTNSRMLGHAYALTPGQYMARFTLLNRLPSGSYRLHAALVREEQWQHPEDCYHWIEQAACFDVVDSVAIHGMGSVLMDANFRLDGISPNAAPKTCAIEWPKTPLRAFSPPNIPLSTFAATISLLRPLDVLPAGMDIIVPIRVQNRSKETWKATGWERPVVVTYRWMAEDGTILIADGLRTYLPGDLVQEGVVTVSLRVRVPDASRQLVLLISPVQETVAWFVDLEPESGLAVPVHIKKG